MADFQVVTQDGYLTGQLLVAMPQIHDHRFHHSVIFICGHDDQGAMGIVINKPMEGFTLRDLGHQLSIKKSSQAPELPVYYGGPVEVGRGFVLHSGNYQSDMSVALSEQYVLTATLDILKQIIQNEGPAQKIIALGYAGWTAGQLESEIKENSWIQLPASQQLVYDQPRETLWEYTLSTLGINPELLMTFSGHA